MAGSLRSRRPTTDMWIYSLGKTLENCVSPETIVSDIPADNCQLSYEWNKNNSGKSPIDLNSPVDGSGGVKSSEPYQISFDYVLAAMCEPDINQRATLMNLLDVISQHCKRHHHQSKPFSHIVVELFNRVVEFKERMARQQPIDNVIRDNTSDSDSGRCSGSTEHSCDGGRGQPQRQTIGMGLRVSRQPIQKFNSLPRVLKNIEMRPIIGSALDLPAVSGDVKTTNGMGKLHVRKRDLILKRRFGSRRNTIEVNSTEMENAMKIYKRQDGIMNGVNASKSVNCLDQIINRSDEIERNRLFNVTSMPDLNTTKIRNPLVSTLKVLRKRVISTETLADNFHIQADGVVKSKGPEFIINSSLPSKEIDLTDTKCQSRRTVNVLLLNGETIKVLCNAGQATVLQIFEAVIRSENLYENYFMGLCALIGGDFVFLPSCLKVYKVAPQLWFNDSKKLPSTDNIIFNLFLRIKFFLPELRGLCSVESRHLLYLQLRKSILESQILCTDDDLILLGGLALQAEVGDFISNMRRSEYFTISHYLPEGVYQRNREMKRYLRNSHFSKRGMHSRDAEQTFIRYVQGMREYGQHLYSAIWSSDDNINHDVYVAISLSGIALFERSTRLNSENLLENGKNPKTSFQRPVYGIFDWLEIENLYFSKHILCIVVRRSDSLEAKNNNRIKYNLKMSGRKSYFAFTLASEHHKFFMKLRNSFLTLKSISDEMNVPLKVANIQHIPSAIKTELENAAEQKKSIENGKSENDVAVENQQSTDKNRVLIEDQVKLIDKKSKGTINRVRNLKKSMLNDNKLIKLKNKFLRRNKSTTNIENVQIPNEMNESNDDNMERNISSSSLLTKEESQNKENENPTILTECFSDPILNNIEKDESNLKYLSPKRNRVKMGTRVLSSQYLNKSFDNIFDNMLDICLFDLNDSMPDLGLNKLNGRRATQPPATTEFPNIEERTVALYSGQSMNEKHSNRMNRQESSNEMCSAKEAFILDSSIKSLTATNFSIENETISDSLLEKFNNISCSTSNTMNDRIITRLIIHKEILNEIIDGNQITDNLLKFANKVRLGTLNMSRSQESLVSSSKSLSTMQSNELLNTNKRDQNDQFTLGISIVQGSDNVVYVKDLVKNGPAEKAGVRIGDQVLAVNGISLMNKPYSESLNMLKNSGHTVELLLSQIYDNRKLKQLPKTQIPNGNLNRNIIPRNVTDNISLNSFKSTDFSIENHSIEDYLNHIRLSTDDILQYTEVKNIFSSHNQNETLKITEENVEIAQTETKLNDVPESWSKSLPDLPKIVGTIPKRKKKQPETDGYNEFDSRHPSLNGIVPKGGRHTRAYSGPIKYPVTPMRPTGSFTKPSLSIMADSKDDDIEL